MVQLIPPECFRKGWKSSHVFPGASYLSEQTGCSGGKRNGKIDTNGIFPEKKGQPSKVVFFLHFSVPKRPEPLEPGSDAMTLYITSLGGDWPPHLFVPRLLRHLEMYSQMERLIPVAISSVGNAQYQL